MQPEVDQSLQPVVFEAWERNCGRLRTRAPCSKLRFCTRQARERKLSVPPAHEGTLLQSAILELTHAQGQAGKAAWLTLISCITVTLWGTTVIQPCPGHGRIIVVPPGVATILFLCVASRHPLGGYNYIIMPWAWLYNRHPPGGYNCTGNSCPGPDFF